MMTVENVLAKILLQATNVQNVKKNTLVSQNAKVKSNIPKQFDISISEIVYTYSILVINIQTFILVLIHIFVQLVSVIQKAQKTIFVMLILAIVTAKPIILLEIIVKNVQKHSLVFLTVKVYDLYQDYSIELEQI